VSGQTFAPFHDITTGHTSTSTNWPALVGYDMATGIGSPDGYNLARDLVGSGGTTNDFSITVSPSSASVTPGASATATVNTALTSGAAQMIGLSATGLPSGATAGFAPTSVSSGGSSTLTVSTTASTPVGSYPLTITGTGTSRTHSTTFTLSVSSTGTLQLVKNKGFERGATFWSMSAGVLNSNGAEPPHLGTYDAWLDGFAAVHTDTVTQTLTVPAGITSGRLKYYLHIDSAETTTTTAFDKLVVKLGSTVVGRFSNLNAAGGYVLHSRAVTLPPGSTVTLSFTGTEDSSLQTSFVLDDITLTTS
jgi:aminopeptidase S